MDIVLVHLMLFYLVYESCFSRCYINYNHVNKENIRNCLGNCFRKYSMSLNPLHGEEKPYTYSELNRTIFSLIDALNTSEFSLFSDDLKVRIVKDNCTVNISFKFQNKADVTTRKMKTQTSNILQYMLVPGFLMAGILPWIMPGLQLAVLAFGMMNNMAFSSALFTLVRSYVFDKEPDEHVVYINHGYRDKHPYR